MKNVHKAMGLLAVLCALAALFACTRENSAPSPTPEPVTIRQQAAGEAESLADMVARLSPSVVGIATRQNGQQGIGSGVIVSADGYILTNHHVAAEGAEVTLIFADGTKELASAVWSSQALDLAIVKAREGSYPAAAMGSVEDVRVGEQVVAIGTPLALQFQHTVTGGIVSALNRTLQVPSGRSTAFMEQLIQTDVAINPGNSGGPLLNQRGEVIGIVTVRVEEAAGIGFAIPIDIARPIVEHFLADGSYVTPKMGAYLFDSEIARYYDANSTMTTGLYVIDVEPGSAAQSAGIQTGDILLRADGRECRTLLDLRYVLFSHRVGETLELEVQRGGEILHLTPKLTAAGDEI
ncbi:MAG TPA: trypsin-like peptidase domain-containing protein [Candidatus Spyradocola merdavium]|nr:trypsin-like peptidase domain-containing protein [Candidatus Spyradocola merdavium]